MTLDYAIRHLGEDDLKLLHGLLDCFAEAFGETETYSARRPGEGYLRSLLAGESFLALVALADGQVIGGLAAYELKKFEQERSEIYIYDLAVAESWRRRGVATALIREVQRLAASRGAWVVFVQADYGDEAAIALYQKLGVREEVLHFDIAVRTPPSAG